MSSFVACDREQKSSFVYKSIPHFNKASHFPFMQNKEVEEFSLSWHANSWMFIAVVIDSIFNL